MKKGTQENTTSENNTNNSKENKLDNVKIQMSLITILMSKIIQ